MLRHSHSHAGACWPRRPLAFAMVVRLAALFVIALLVGGCPGAIDDDDDSTPASCDPEDLGMETAEVPYTDFTDEVGFCLDLAGQPSPLVIETEMEFNSLWYCIVPSKSAINWETDQLVVVHGGVSGCDAVLDIEWVVTGTPSEPDVPAGGPKIEPAVPQTVVGATLEGCGMCDAWFEYGFVLAVPRADDPVVVWNCPGCGDDDMPPPPTDEEDPRPTG